MSIKAKAKEDEHMGGHANDNEPDKAARFKKDFTFTRYCELGQTTKAKRFVIDGVMAAGESSYTVAKPDSGKSVIHLDMDFHVAAGLDWHGYPVMQGLAINFAFERYDLQLRRGMALRQNYKNVSPDIPLVIVGGKFDLHANLRDATRMVDLINYLQDEYQTVFRSGTLDTLTKSFGRGKQNVGEDMKAYFDSVQLLLDKFPTAHITVVHHEGHSTDRANEVASKLIEMYDVKQLTKINRMLIDHLKHPERTPFQRSAALGFAGLEHADGRPFTKADIAQIHCWRVEGVDAGGQRWGNGVHLATEDEAKLYAEYLAREDNMTTSVIRIPGEPALNSITIDDDCLSIGFMHGKCGDLKWKPLPNNQAA